MHVRLIFIYFGMTGRAKCFIGWKICLRNEHSNTDATNRSISRNVIWTLFICIIKFRWMGSDEANPMNKIKLYLVSLLIVACETADV